MLLPILIVCALILLVTFVLGFALHRIVTQRLKAEQAIWERSLAAYEEELYRIIQAAYND